MSRSGPPHTIWNHSRIGGAHAHSLVKEEAARTEFVGLLIKAVRLGCALSSSIIFSNYMSRLGDVNSATPAAARHDTCTISSPGAASECPCCTEFVGVGREQILTPLSLVHCNRAPSQTPRKLATRTLPAFVFYSSREKCDSTCEHA